MSNIKSVLAAAQAAGYDAKKLQSFCNGKIDRAFTTGLPGTGKSFGLVNFVLPVYFDINPQHTVTIVAFTNKAASVIRDYVRTTPYASSIVCTTIHKFCKLVPTLNDSATSHKDLHGNSRTGEADECDLLVVDECFMVDDEINDALEQVWQEDKYRQMYCMGDRNQLKPVNGKSALLPQDDDWRTHLTAIRRSDKPDIQAAIVELADRIENKRFHPRFRLKASENIVRGKPDDAEVVCAYRNKTVQEHNADIQGYDMVCPGDTVYCDTRKQEYKVLDTYGARNFIEKELLKIRGKNGVPDHCGDYTDTYNTRNRLYSVMAPRMSGTLMGMLAYPVDGTEDEAQDMAIIFGTGDYRDTNRRLLEAAMEGNEMVVDAFGLKEEAGPRGRKRIIDKDGRMFKDLSAFCKVNNDLRNSAALGATKEQREALNERALAWSCYMTFKELIFHADFVHARTCYALQGSSVDSVYVDTADMARSDDDTYHRMLYVGLSRARNKVYI